MLRCLTESRRRLPVYRAVVDYVRSAVGGIRLAVDPRAIPPGAPRPLRACMRDGRASARCVQRETPKHAHAAAATLDPVTVRANASAAQVIMPRMNDSAAAIAILACRVNSV